MISLSFSDSGWPVVSIPRATFLPLFKTATDDGCPYLGLHFRSLFQTATDTVCPYLGLHFCLFFRQRRMSGVHTLGYIFGLFLRQRLTPGVHPLGYIFVSFSDSNGCRVSIPWATFLSLFQTATDAGCPYLGLHFCLFYRQRLTPGVHTSGSLTITQNGPHQFQ